MPSEKRCQGSPCRSKILHTASVPTDVTFHSKLIVGNHGVQSTGDVRAACLIAMRYMDLAACGSRTQWDKLLDEMKGMREDFRGERRWKHATGRHLAEHCDSSLHCEDSDKIKMRVQADSEYKNGIVFEDLKEVLMDPRITLIDRSFDSKTQEWLYHVRRSSSRLTRAPKMLQDNEVATEEVGFEHSSVSHQVLMKLMSDETIVYVNREIADDGDESFTICRPRQTSNALAGLGSTVPAGEEAPRIQLLVQAQKQEG